MQEEMGSDERRSLSWGFIDGSVSVSASMLVALLIHGCHSCADVWFIGYLKETSDKSAGLVVVATLLLFPTAAVIYGGVHLFFAAKEAFERRQRKLRLAAQEAGRQAGRQEERERIGQAVEALTERGAPITQQEIARILEDESEQRS